MINFMKQEVIDHIYTVEIRFFGDVLNREEITQFLGLHPKNCLDRNKNKVWGYNGEGENGFQIEWESLEQGLYFLFFILSPLRTKIIEISKKYRGIWWCGHFQESFDGGPTLSPEILVELASYELPIFIDNYFVN